jgi:hypothetical protein
MNNRERTAGRVTGAGLLFDVSAEEGTVKTATSYGMKSEKGIALMVVLILSGVALALMTALIYMITSGTQISGFQKRYKTSLEASKGGGDLFYMLVGFRGDVVDTTQFKNDMDASGLNSSIPLLASACSGTSLGGTHYTGLQAKLMTPTSSWQNCSKSISIDPGDPATYDMKLELGPTNKYIFYGKIVETLEGNTGPGGTGGDSNSRLLNKGVVSSGVGEIQVMQKPYLYAMEVMAANSVNTNERSKFSILYQY